jgi:cytochrome bd-type quinol oxidase subunit 2
VSRNAALVIGFVLLVALGPLLTLEFFLHNIGHGRTRKGTVVVALIVLVASLAFVLWAFLAHPGEAVRTLWTPAIYLTVGVVDLVALVLLVLASGRRGRPQSSTAWITWTALLVTLIAGIGNALVFFLWGPFDFG